MASSNVFALDRTLLAILKVDPNLVPTQRAATRLGINPELEEIDFLRSDTRYTLVAWRGEGGTPGEALISTPLKELLPQLDAATFAQVHRSVVVNLASISHVTRGANETADIHLKGRPEKLPVSRSYLHLFKQM